MTSHSLILPLVTVFRLFELTNHLPVMIDHMNMLNKSFSLKLLFFIAHVAVELKFGQDFCEFIITNNDIMLVLSSMTWER